MYAMQYKIKLPDNYDMELIKSRVKLNGYKTDKFDGLLFKAYLISEINSNSLSNSYCPLYLWKNTDGMNKFIFNGFFDNILNSFGWQNIEIGITAFIKLTDSVSKSKYLIEQCINIPPQKSLNNFDFPSNTFSNELGKVIIYNPDKWKYVTFSFFEHKPVIADQTTQIYSILHLSLGS
ncbi:DUF4865 domain-containing protein [Gilliamella sp. Fer2-1]|jgi:hypothetical protein|nr:DUF4865 domain-containing protein [Gilliamella apicola]